MEVNLRLCWESKPFKNLKVEVSQVEVSQVKVHSSELQNYSLFSFEFAWIVIIWNERTAKNRKIEKQKIVSFLSKVFVQHQNQWSEMTGVNSLDLCLMIVLEVSFNFNHIKTNNHKNCCSPKTWSLCQRSSVGFPCYKIASKKTKLAAIFIFWQKKTKIGFILAKKLGELSFPVKK